MGSAKKKHVMIVDDDTGVLKAVGRFLTNRGYLVSMAAGGREALKKIPQEKPDLVLLDALMPEMDGVETLELIRKKFPKTQVVMISALREEAVAKASVKMGAGEWLVKPFSMEQLETTISMTLLHGKSYEKP